MNNSINIVKAKEIMHKYLKTEHLIHHSLESGAVLGAVAKELGEDEVLWTCIGLLHDIDLDLIGDDLSRHGIKAVELLKEEGFEILELTESILSHTEGLTDNPYVRKTKLDYALAASENVTGLISAYVLMRPDKKIDGAKVKSLTKKFKDKAFAAKVNREFINDIEKVGIDRNRFFEIAINAIKEIADEVGF